MTLEEAEKILGPEVVAKIRARVTPRPLTAAQTKLIVGVMGAALDAADADEARAEVPGEHR